MGRRTWIKLYCDNWLHGSIRKEIPIVRDVFSGLLTMAGDSRFGDIGEIYLSEEVGMTDEQIAGTLNVSLEEWANARAILSNHPKGPEENRIIISPLKIGIKIKVIKWVLYQGEYDRQKKYRLMKSRREMMGSQLDLEDCNLKLQERPSNSPCNSKLQTISENASNLKSFTEGEGEGEREREGEKKEEDEENARAPRATASSSEFVSFSKTSIPEIIKIFEKNGFPELSKNRKLIDYVSFLCFENLDFDHEDVISGKLAHYRDKPPKKRANLCLAFKNWFSVERKIHEDRQRNAFSPNVGRRKK